ncbi:MAG: hypothetical protein IJS08_15945 [Victivallales bacterium]|nr:hypothetical protein [Victivallales bacterium]
MKYIYTFFMILFPLFAAETHNALVTFSNGTSVEGKLSIMGSRPLYINTSKDTRTKDRKVELEDIVSITQKVEQATMERPWMYKESGKTDKIYFEGEYPLLNFETELLLVNGEVLRGHIISLPLRFKGKGPSKLFLQRQIKGEVGQKLEDIEYVTSITFERKVLEAKAISGTVDSLGILQQVCAVDRERHFVQTARIQGNSFSFPQLLPGKYDIFVMTEDAVLAGFTGSGEIPEELQKNFSLADDFFKERFLLRLNETRTLVYKRRGGDFYHSKKHVGNGYIWHLEIWNWHKAGDEWKLDSRDLPLRVKQKDDKAKRLYGIKALEAVEPGVEIKLGKEHENDFIRSLE